MLKFGNLENSGKIEVEFWKNESISFKIGILMNEFLVEQAGYRINECLCFRRIIVVVTEMSDRRIGI